MRYDIIRPKSHEEWLEARKSGLGSSEVGTILGLNPFDTPYKLWRRKVGIDPPIQENFAMKAGHYLEDAVSKFFADEMGADIIKASATDWLAKSKEKPFMQVSPDRTYWLNGEKHNEANKRILECKTTQMQIDYDNIPKYWFAQLQYQLHVTGYDGGALAWLTQGRDFGYRLFDRNEEVGTVIEASVERFWVDNILGMQEPSAINADDVCLKFSRHMDGKVVEVSEDIFNAYEKLIDIKDALKQLEEQKNNLEDAIKQSFGDAEAIEFGGRRLATFKAPKPSQKFDAKAFQAEHQDMASQYMVDYQGARRLLLK